PLVGNGGSGTVAAQPAPRGAAAGLPGPARPGRTAMNTHDVVIVGGGPTGLMLAAELALAGGRPLVLGRLAAPTGLSKALALVGRAVDLLDHRGLLDRFAAHSPARTPAFAHFGMIPLDLSVVADLGVRGVFVQQARTEQILHEWAVELGVEIR